MSNSSLVRPKVLFTSHTANFSKFNRPFMRWFRENDWEVHYASVGEEDILDCDKEFKVPFERSPLKLNNFKAYRQLKKIIDDGSYDIIHTHTPVGSVVTRLAARQARRRGTRVIYTAHGFHFFKGAPLINWLAYYPIEWLASFITDDLVLINSEDYERARKHLHAKRTHYLKGGVGVDLSRFRPASKAEKLKLRNKYGYKDSDTIIIYIAEFIKRKNHRIIIDSLHSVAKKRADIRIIFCGVGDLETEMAALAKNLGVLSRIDFLGYRTDTPRLLQLSDIFVSASRQEGLPIAVVEAMACGLPVLLSANRGHNEIGTLQSGGVVSFFNSQSDLSESLTSSKRNDIVASVNMDIFSVDNALTQFNNIYKVSHR